MTNLAKIKELYGDHYLCYLVSEGIVSPKKAGLILERKLITPTKLNPEDEYALEKDLKNCEIMQIFKLSEPNAKIGHWSFSLRSGWTCPFARKCHAKVVVDKKTGKKKLVRGEESQWTCFSASQEVLYPGVYKQRLYNEELVKKVLKEGGIKRFVEVMQATFEANKNKIYKSGYFRIHVGGDFFNQEYFDAWVEFAKLNQDIIFYSYTKSAPYVLNTPQPQNFIITNSLGGNYDKQIIEGGLKFVAVLWKPEDVQNIQPSDTAVKNWKYIYDDGTESRPFDLPIDHDDSNAYMHNKPFALLIHGKQKAGSLASQATMDLKHRKVKYSYPKKKKETIEPNPVNNHDNLAGVERIKENKMKKSELIKIINEEIENVLSDMQKHPWSGSPFGKNAILQAVDSSVPTYEEKNCECEEGCCDPGAKEVTLEKGSSCMKKLVEMMKECKKSGKIEECNYEGSTVKLNTPMKGDVKKYKAYVRDQKTGNIKKVNFGD